MSGGLKLGTLLRLTAGGMVVFSLSGVAMVLAMHWAERTWPADERQSVTEAELQPERANFLPVGDAPPPAGRRGVTYVPVYSTVYLGNREVQAGLAVTLSLRNTSPEHALVVHRLDYYDTAGQRAKRLVEAPHAVPAMATAKFFIDRRDPIGGPGANYLVEWSVPEGGTAPVIEAIMVGRFGSAGISFGSRGVILRGAGPGEG